MRPALVTVHGFMGNSKIFDALLPIELEERYERFDLSLAGHGGTIDEFCANGLYDWQASVNELLSRLSQDGRKVFIITHSMGGLLAILYSIEHADCVAGIVAIALPLRIKLGVKALRMRLRAVLPSKGDDDKAAAACREMCGVSGLRLINSYRLIPNSLALLRLSARARRLLSALQVPLLVVNSENDEIVATSSLRYLQRVLPHAKQLKLNSSMHFLYTAVESSKIRSLIADKLL